MRPWLLPLACLCLLTAAAAPCAADETPRDSIGDVCYVAKGDALPNQKVTENDMKRVKPLFEKLQDGHRLRIEFALVSKAVTNYTTDIRHVRRITTINAKDQPEGEEVDYADWYRHSSRTASYKGGVLDGLERQFEAETGAVLAEVPWVRGQIHGPKRTYHADGKLANETAYENGVIKGASRSFAADGRLLRTVEFENGERHGNMTEYWQEKPDQVRQIVPYRKGVVEGLAKAFYLSGKLKWERPFKNNRQHGIEKQYDADGKVEKTLYWLNGDQVSAEEYAKQGGRK